jgi:uncharacterized protein (DUF1684 family)
MNQKNIIQLAFGTLVVIILIYSFSGGQTTEEYIASIEDERQEKDIFMKNSDDSPFKNSEKKYHGLLYYPIDIRYKITARFIEPNKKSIVKLSTNDNEEREYLEYGYAEFSFSDKSQKLLILENVEDEVLFLAFGDETSAIDTYGAGRYLDVKHSGGASITLDFNLAYNPYCAYANQFSCPLPPRQNLLSVAIEAGEKTYQ